MADTPPADRDPPTPPTGDWTDPHGDLERRLREATAGEYEILSQLGFGGMASVYLAYDPSLDRRVAIKVMSPAMVYGPGLVERFRLEAKTAAALSHPNIIPIYAVRETNGLLYFVMKVIEGTSLDAVIGEVGPLPIPMVEALFAQAAGALGYAHRRGVVHRDIKPANILLDEEGWVVVTDFGIAKVTDASVLTMTGVAVGTPTYMSPEQCAGDEISGASDQYSLGIVTYEMLTGRPPFVETSVPALMIGHTTKQPPSIEAVRPDCPPALRQAVERMLAKNPQDRFPSLEDAIVAADAHTLAPDDRTRGTLVSLARHGTSRRMVAQVRTPRSPVPLMHRSGQQEPTPKPRRSLVHLGGWLIAGVAVTALAITMLRRSPAPEPNAPGQVAVSDSDSTVAPPPTAPTAPREMATNPAPTPPPPSPAASRSEPNTAASSPATTTQVAPAPPPPPPAMTVDSPPPAQDSPTTRPANTPAAVPPRVVTPPPPPAAPPAKDSVPSDPRAQVDSVVRAYARALESGKLDTAVRLFPEMPADQRQGLQAFYRDGGSMETHWQTRNVVIKGSTATLDIVGSNSIRTARNAPSDQQVSLHARLERTVDGWRLVGLEN